MLKIIIRLIHHHYGKNNHLLLLRVDVCLNHKLTESENNFPSLLSNR